MTEAPSMFFQLSGDEIRALLENGDHLSAPAILRLSRAYQEHTSAEVQAFRDNAPQADGLDYDDHPVVSRSDEGAYVMAWVWVSNEDAGLQEEEA